MADAAALNDHGVGTDQHIVLHNHRGGGSGLNDPRQYGPGSHMAVLAHGGPATQDGTHIDHGALTHHGTDV